MYSATIRWEMFTIVVSTVVGTLHEISPPNLFPLVMLEETPVNDTKNSTISVSLSTLSTSLEMPTKSTPATNSATTPYTV